MSVKIGIFRKRYGNLFIPSINLLISKKLRKNSFIEMHKKNLLYSDKYFLENMVFFIFLSQLKLKEMSLGYQYTSYPVGLLYHQFALGMG